MDGCSFLIRQTEPFRIGAALNLYHAVYIHGFIFEKYEQAQLAQSDLALHSLLLHYQFLSSKLELNPLPDDKF